jgi:hypothetical protein
MARAKRCDLQEIPSKFVCPQPVAPSADPGRQVLDKSLGALAAEDGVDTSNPEPLAHGALLPAEPPQPTPRILLGRVSTDLLADGRTDGVALRGIGMGDIPIELAFSLPFFLDFSSELGEGGGVGEGEGEGEGEELEDDEEVFSLLPKAHRRTSPLGCFA